MKITDAFGNDVQVGDEIIYKGTKWDEGGRKQTLKKGIVQKIIIKRSGIKFSTMPIDGYYCISLAPTSVVKCSYVGREL